MSEKSDIPRIPETQPPELISPVRVAFDRFTRLEASGGIVLLAMTVLAMVWANSPWSESYYRLWQGTTITVGVPELFAKPQPEPHRSLPGAQFIEGPLPASADSWPLAISMPLLLWINDGLMAVFFFLIGLEIKREVLVGELRSIRRAALPIAAAIGGMVVPALIYAAINWERPTIRGWGVPVATDIAFALGVLALLGRRLPAALRVFLATLAIADDIGALLVIAIFYTDHLAYGWLIGAAVALGLMLLHNRLGVRDATPYALAGLLLWFMVLKSGVHATIAGVLGAAAIPVRTRSDVRTFAEFVCNMGARLRGESGNSSGMIITNPRQQAMVQGIEDATDKVQTPLEKLEHTLAPIVAFAILPIFALANAGVTFGAGWADAAFGRVSMGVVAGLLLGKPLGVALASVLAVKTGIGILPTGVRLSHLHGVAWLTGIGFTMSLFIANLAFTDAEHLDAAKMGVLGASALAAVVGLALLAHSSRGAPARPST